MEMWKLVKYEKASKFEPLDKLLDEHGLKPDMAFADLSTFLHTGLDIREKRLLHQQSMGASLYCCIGYDLGKPEFEKRELQFKHYYDTDSPHNSLALNKNQVVAMMLSDILCYWIKCKGRDVLQDCW